MKTLFVGASLTAWPCGATDLCRDRRSPRSAQPSWSNQCCSYTSAHPRRILKNAGSACGSSPGRWGTRQWHPRLSWEKICLKLQTIWKSETVKRDAHPRGLMKDTSNNNWKDRMGRKSGYICRAHQSILICQLWGGHKGNTAPTGLIKEWVALHYLLITLSPPREPVWSQTQAQAPPPYVHTDQHTHTHLWSLTGTKESTQEVPMVHNLIKREK